MDCKNLAYGHFCEGQPEEQVTEEFLEHWRDYCNVKNFNDFLVD